ncbi:MAG: RNA polymerase sigma factor [Rubripirellula sp.]
MTVAKLIDDARLGSSESLDELLEFYRPYILRLAEDTIAPWLRPKLSASDVTQGTIVLAWDRFTQFEGETSSDFRAWLLAIFRNHLRDGVRRYRYSDKRKIDREEAEVSPTLHGNVVDPADLVAEEESVQRLLACIESLPEESRSIVRLRYVKGMSFMAISGELGCSADKARRVWLSAIDELAQRLGHS